jgi:hypothetical protein
MPAEAPATGRWQSLTHQEGAKVMVTTKDGDRFVLRVEHAILGCRAAEKCDSFSQQLSELMNLLHQWVVDRSDAIDRAYLAPDADGFVFCVIRKGTLFDPRFEDDLSDLDLRVCNDDAFSLIQLRVIALPYSSSQTVESFLNVSNAFVAQPSR